MIESKCINNDFFYNEKCKIVQNSEYVCNKLTFLLMSDALITHSSSSVFVFWYIYITLLD